MSTWYVYILRCADDTLYTGITTDLERRVREHNGTSRGARYTRTRRPVELVYYEESDGRADATRREGEIKEMTSARKRALIVGREGSGAPEEAV